MLVKQLDVSLEIIDVEQIRKIIPLCRIDYAPVFIELDALIDPRLDNLRQRIWLWDKISRTKLLAFHFGILIRR